jgi:hypothetical protein
MTRFKARGLGSLCFAFTAQGGRFQPGDTFVPTPGKVIVLGGTGAAARWNAPAAYSLKAITGISTEKFRFSGTAHGTIAKKARLEPGLQASRRPYPRLTRPSTRVPAPREGLARLLALVASGVVV